MEPIELARQVNAPLPPGWDADAFAAYLAEAIDSTGEVAPLLSRCERLLRLLSQPSTPQPESPLRAMQFLCRQFLPSPFFARTLASDPGLLAFLSDHEGLSAFRSRSDFEAALRTAWDRGASFGDVRRRQRRSLARLAACDLFNVLDLKTVTLQLSLLADATVRLAASVAGLPRRTAILALGKLGGEELNYSSDIDLVVISEAPPGEIQRAVAEMVRLVEGDDGEALYRVDMRLRPWGVSGPLACTRRDLRGYLAGPAEAWERQAFLKVRAIGGDPKYGERAIDELRETVLAGVDREKVRSEVRRQRDEIEAANDSERDLKAGRGAVRDVEFAVQALQLLHGRRNPAVLSNNTLDALRRLAGADLIDAEQYRLFTDGYLLLRTVEHTLQLRQNRQTHRMPIDIEPLRSLAGRLDYPSVEAFLDHLTSYRDRIAELADRIFDRDRAAVDEPNSDPEEESAVFQLEQPRMSESVARLRLRFEAGGEPQIDLLPTLTSTRLIFVLPDDPLALPTLCDLIAATGATITRGRARRSDHFVEGWFELPSAQPPLDAETLTSRTRAAMGSSEPFAHWLTERPLESPRTGPPPLLPLEIEIDRGSGRRTTVSVQADDRPRFLAEMAHSLVIAGLRIERLRIETSGGRVLDRFVVTGLSPDDGERLATRSREHELRATLVLAKHFLHLLPRSPNPANALRNFRDFLRTMFGREDWVRDLATLQQSQTLSALSSLLGVSDFLWHDFLRYQHKTLFPVLSDVEQLREPRSEEKLSAMLEADLAEIGEGKDGDWPAVVNRFKDREMLRADMRHILGLEETFGRFSQELTAIAEVVVATTFARLLDERLAGDVPYALCALGKCGGREMGFASDVELLVVYGSECDREAGRAVCDCVDQMQRTIRTRRAGVFEIDLRLRPYGTAGPLACSLDTFAGYFASESAGGEAWPFERQALIRLRAFSGDPSLCVAVERKRDEVVYSLDWFDLAALTAMRESQIQQHVTGGAINAKLSRGGLVDIEYFTQALQIRFGRETDSVRAPNTRAALRALAAAGSLDEPTRVRLRDALRFLRTLIDALRMVRGDARDLTIPDWDTDAAAFLARRLGLGSVDEMRTTLVGHMSNVREIIATLPRRLEGADR